MEDKEDIKIGAPSIKEKGDFLQDLNYLGMYRKD